MSPDPYLELAWAGLRPDRLAALLAGASSPEEAARRLRRQLPDLPALQEMWRRLAELGVGFVAAADPGFPPQLAALDDPPAGLFLRGGLPAEPGVAIVGSRKATRYGLGMAEAMGAAVATCGWVVVSGLARGVDGAAHRGTLEVGGVGVAVMGCGLDMWYPAEHRGLGERLVAGGGAVVSEFPPGTRPEPWRFPLRNRIIAALAAVVVVVEAAVDGGALITARLALEQGRDVFVVPGDVDRPTSQGCNLLIRDGAHPVLGADDLVASLELVMGPPPRPVAHPEPDQGLLALLGAAGATLDELAERHPQGAAAALAEVGRLQAAGLVTVEAGVVRRAT